MQNAENLIDARVSAAAPAAAASDFLAPLARILLAAPFLPSGAGKIFNFAATAEMMRGEGMPLAELFLVGAIFLELVGGLMLVAGFGARIGALLLIVFLVPATVIFHDFWTFAAAEQMNQMTQFLKNLGILGGLTALLYFGAGAYSFDNRAARRTV